jgi:hypothetical protein
MPDRPYHATLRIPHSLFDALRREGYRLPFVDGIQHQLADGFAVPMRRHRPLEVSMTL